jgi:hypothetical protein
VTVTGCKVSVEVAVRDRTCQKVCLAFSIEIYVVKQSGYDQPRGLVVRVSDY